MPDGVVAEAPGPGSGPEVTPAEARLLRGVRVNLALWSGGITLIVLLVLGTVLYLAVERSLTASGTAQLVARAEQLTGGRRDAPGDLPEGGLIFGGPNSGTLTMVLDDGGQPVRPVPPGLPVTESFVAAKATGERDLRSATITMTVVTEGSPGGEPVVEPAGAPTAAEVTTPVRVLTDPVRVRGQPFYLQVVGDRTTEERTLRILVVVLVVGGLVALLAASGVGAAYAQRALVPIRRSLVDQREALRRQREFAADASHELRTPLTVIRASVDDLGRHASEPVASVGSALTDIRDEVDHLTAMVDDLLLLARSDSGAVELERIAVDLGDIASTAAAALSRPATRGVEVVVDPAPAELTGDPARLRQLVMILLDNAIRHSPGGGRVFVRVRVDGPEAIVVVEDDGPGIRGEDLPRLFDRFYRAAGAPGGGTGLGLAIAAWIAERHGGRVEAANRAEGGARFTVRLPIRRPAAGTTA
ncbi:MAG: sensor histidine kinase [Candidatus Limnocylindrales bacterium]